MIQKEFKLRDKNFRVNMSSIDLLSLSYCLDFEDIKKISNVFSFILEHIETEIAGKWVQVKATNQDVYFPVGIENDLSFLKEIETYFMTEVLMNVFHNSN